MQREQFSADLRSDADRYGRSDRIVDAVDALRRAEAHLVRRRQAGAGLSDVDRTALRLVIERSLQAEHATPTDLARHLGISTASTTALVDRLVRGGLIETHPHPIDRRKKTLSPTAGTRHPDEVGSLAASIREVAADLSDTEAQLLIGALARITRAVDDEEIV
ncbi:MAG: MarR family transcriptional regulator [Microbacteriaceae bacterium]